MTTRLFTSNKWNAELKGRNGGVGAKIGMRVTWGAGSWEKIRCLGWKAGGRKGFVRLAGGGRSRDFFFEGPFFGYFFCDALSLSKWPSKKSDPAG